MSKVVIVTGMHGNERMPIVALASRGIPQLVANTRAVAADVRFIDQDLNGAFGKPVTDYESGRAEELLKLINPNSAVLDLHSTASDAGPFVIIVDPAMLTMALQTGLKRVVYMKYSVKKGGALINFRSGVSVEVGNHTDPKGFEVAISVAERILSEAEPLKVEDVELYEVYDEITDPGEYENFVLHEQGFYPLFAKKNTYGNYGLKAKLVKQFS